MQLNCPVDNLSNAIDVSTARCVVETSPIQVYDFFYEKTILRCPPIRSSFFENQPAPGSPGLQGNPEKQIWQLFPGQAAFTGGIKFLSLHHGHCRINNRKRTILLFYGAKRCSHGMITIFRPNITLRLRF